MPLRTLGTIQLSARQAEIVDLVARGMTDRKIADTLGISVRTVGNYLTHLYEVTGCENRTQLAVLVGQSRRAVDAGVPRSGPASKMRANGKVKTAPSDSRQRGNGDAPDIADS